MCRIYMGQHLRGWIGLASWGLVTVRKAAYYFVAEVVLEVSDTRYPARDP